MVLLIKSELSWNGSDAKRHAPSVPVTVDRPEEETGTGTFNAANWAVWDASDLRDNCL